MLHRITVRLHFDGGTSVWWFALAPDGKEGRNGLRLQRLPFSTLPSQVRRTEVSNFRRRQSSRESGYRDVVLSGRVRNSSSCWLDDVAVHIFWHGLSQASATIPCLEPGQEVDFEATWKDAFIAPSPDFPPISGELLRGRLRVRVVYRAPTPEGDIWAEDSIFGPDMG